MTARTGGLAEVSASPSFDWLMTRGEQIGPLERGVVEVVEIRGRENDAAGDIAPCSDQRRQAGYGARGNAAAGVALHAIVEPDRRGPGSSVVPRELYDFFAADAA